MLSLRNYNVVSSFVLQQCHMHRSLFWFIRYDQVAILELLPKLAATIPRTTDRGALKSIQKRCEPLFTELIQSGVSSTVRWVRPKPFMLTNPTLHAYTYMHARCLHVWHTVPVHPGS